jgi:hypothetical protein
MTILNNKIVTMVCHMQKKALAVWLMQIPFGGLTGFT